MHNKFSKKLLMFSLLTLITTPAAQADPLQDATIALSSLTALLGTSYVGFKAFSWTGGKINKGLTKVYLMWNEYKAQSTAYSLVKDEMLAEQQESENAEEKVENLINSDQGRSKIQEKKSELLAETNVFGVRTSSSSKITKFFKTLPITTTLKYGAIATALVTLGATLNDASVKAVVHI